MPRHSPCALYSLTFLFKVLFLELLFVYVIVNLQFLSLDYFQLATFAVYPNLSYLTLSILFIDFALFSFQGAYGGIKWARTTDLTLIRRVL